jgi:hypothetical protein
VTLQCNDSGRTMEFGIQRDQDRLKKIPLSAEILSAVRQLQPSAGSRQWWDAVVKMRNPATDWRPPEILWRMHTDATFLESVAEQLLAVAQATGPILDRMARKG